MKILPNQYWQAGWRQNQTDSSTIQTPTAGPRYNVSFIVFMIIIITIIMLVIMVMKLEAQSLRTSNDIGSCQLVPIRLIPHSTDLHSTGSLLGPTSQPHIITFEGNCIFDLKGHLIEH